MVQIFHNPRCSKSRAGLQYLNDNNIEYTIVDYLKEGINAEKIKELAHKIGCNAIDIVRTHEEYYKKELKGKQFSEDEWFKLIANNPKLLHRPIMVNGSKAVFAQPADKVQEII